MKESLRRVFSFLSVWCSCCTPDTPFEPAQVAICKDFSDTLAIRGVGNFIQREGEWRFSLYDSLVDRCNTLEYRLCNVDTNAISEKAAYIVQGLVHRKVDQQSRLQFAIDINSVVSLVDFPELDPRNGTGFVSNIYLATSCSWPNSTQIMFFVIRNEQEYSYFSSTYGCSFSEDVDFSQHSVLFLLARHSGCSYTFSRDLRVNDNLKMVELSIKSHEACLCRPLIVRPHIVLVNKYPLDYTYTYSYEVIIISPN